jgi:serine/threonine protein kinase
VSASGTSEGRSLSPTAIRAQVVRISENIVLAKSDQLIRFLQYVVEQTLAGQAGNLKEYTIAIEVFGRPQTHDPRVDPIVRTEARRLRARLEQYYFSPGLFDPIVIELPKGGYVPVFSAREWRASYALPATVPAFSHYRLLEVLGESEAQVVYRAEDTRLNRTVVLRVLSPSASRGLRRDELERSASLKHPNCNTFLEMDVCDGHFFVVGSYVEGVTLQNLLEKGPLPFAQALRIADELSLGLWAAHQRGIVHRNLKPSNVAIGQGGEAKILELGLWHLKQKGSAYLAPEQIKGNPGTQHSDVWSVGVILYQMVSGRLPFHGESPELLGQAIVHHQPDPLTASGADESIGALEPLIQKCLEKNPTDRHLDVSEFGTELRRIRTESSDADLKVLSSTSGRKKKIRLWISAGVLAVAALAGVLTLNPWRTIAPPTPPLEPSIAVLPFDDLSPGGGSQALAGAISESLISTLSKLKGFRVVSRTSAESVKQKKMSVQEIASRLKVDYLIEGSLIKAPDASRVTVQLIRTSDDSHLLSGEYDFQEPEILKMVAQVSERVVRQVRMRVDPIAERTIKSGHSSIDPAAYNEYAQGRYEAHLFQNTLRPEHATRAEHHLLRAIELNPNVVLYSAALAEFWQALLYTEPSNRNDLLRKIRDTLSSALRVEPNNAQVQYLTSYADVIDGNLRNALDLSRSAVDLEPGNPSTHYQLAVVYGAMGFYESALYSLEEAIRRDTLYLGSYVQKAHYLTKLDRISEAKEVLETVREFDSAGLVSGLITSEICHRQKDFNQWIETWKSIELRSGASPVTVRSAVDLELALASASRGDLARGREYVRNPGDLRYRRLDHGILLAATIGEKDLAFSLVRESPFFNSYRWLSGEPTFAKWRKDAGYKKLATELYTKWQRDFVDLRSTLPVVPPVLPAPN